jgi:hypothetical protein
LKTPFVVNPSLSPSGGLGVIIIKPDTGCITFLALDFGVDECAVEVDGEDPARTEGLRIEVVGNAMPGGIWEEGV